MTYKEEDERVERELTRIVDEAELSNAGKKELAAILRIARPLECNCAK